MSINTASGFDLSNFPLAPNPSGAPPDFKHGASLRPLVLGFDTTMIVISAIFVGIRAWVNCRQLSKVMLDDVFCILGWMLFCGYAIVCMTLSTTAKHTWNVPLSAITPAWLKRNAVLVILYPLSTWAAKLAIFVMYLRLFGRAKWIKWACWLGIGFSTVLYWAAVIILSNYNFPKRGKHWDLLLGLKIQSDNKNYVVWLIVGSFNMFLDVLLLVLPLPIVMGLKMSLQKRVGLAAVFFIGVVGITGGILGVYYRVYINRQKFTDPTWYAAAISLVISVELFVTLFVSCFPACVSFYKTALRDSRFVTTIKSHLPSVLTKTYMSKSNKSTSRSGKTNSRWLGSRSETKRSTTAAAPEQWKSESKSKLTAHGEEESPTFEMVPQLPQIGVVRTVQTPTRSGVRPVFMGEIVKSVDIRQTTS